ncbi:hypothetical protein FGI04_11775 [Dickeya ananatis]|nr:hypothetical protein FGI04_11775 [Dickeya zeae]
MHSISIGLVCSAQSWRFPGTPPVAGPTQCAAFKWIRIIYRCWKNRPCYDEAKYLQTLKE